MSKTILWTTVGTVAVSAVGLILDITRRSREKLFDQQFEQLEVEVLEGEGGICLN